jgi:D-aminopeptidase
MTQSNSRLRDFGVTPGRLPTGALNAITDVSGVKVGHVTLISGDGALKVGEGPIRTGVTAILPHGGNTFREKVSAGVCTINGFGKATGFQQVRERGVIETPILLTNTLNIGRVSDALIGYMLRDNPDIGVKTGTVNPIVAECNDGFLNDLRGRHVHEIHVWTAIDKATGGAVPEGNVGAGTGTACYQFKGGIGTSSRLVLDGRYTVGALVQTNHGLRPELMILGVPLGQHLLEDYLPQPGPGSIIMVLATDAPFDSRQLTRLAMRATFGLARTGSVSQDGSGDFAIAFSIMNRWQHEPQEPIETVTRVSESGKVIDEFFFAVAEAVEEAILNALVAAETMTGRDGNTLYALPHDVLTYWLDHYRRR